MKKLYWKCAIFVQVLSMVIILLALRRNVLNTLTAAQRHWVYAIPPLSSKPRASRMVFKGIMCFALIVFFVSCRSSSMVQCGSTVVQDSAMLSHVIRSTDTVYQHDSVYRHDSIIYREIVRHDTVYITKEVYRDTHNSSLIARNSAQADTVRVTEYRDRVIEHPPEKYVPKFYKWCTGLMWVMVVLIVLLVVIKWRLKSFS